MPVACLRPRRSLIMSLLLAGLALPVLAQAPNAPKLLVPPLQTTEEQTTEDAISSEPQTAPAAPVLNQAPATPAATTPATTTLAATTPARLPLNACTRTRGTAENPLPPAPDCKWHDPAQQAATAPTDATPAPTDISINQPGSQSIVIEAPAGDNLLVVEEETGIESGELNLVDIAGMGLLHDDTGLGRDLWQGGKRTDILALLGQTGQPAHSPALQQGLRRLLLTAAPWPAIDARDQQSSADLIFGTDAITLRHMALTTIGENQAALDLSRDIPAAGRTDELARLMTESRLVQADWSLCEDVLAAETAQIDEPDHFHTRLRILCLAKTGDGSNAEFLFARLEEKGYSDAALLDAIFVLAGDESALDALDNRDLLSIASLTAANIPVPAPAEGSRDDLQSRLSILKAKGTAIPARITLAENMFAEGYPVAGLVRGLWQSLSFTDDMLAHPRRALRDIPADPATAPHGLALLWQYVMRQEDPLNTVLALQDFWAMARQQNQLPLAIQVSAPILKSLAPQPAILGYGPDIVLGLVLTGDQKRALEWDGMARRFARSGDPIAITAVRRNWAPLMLMRAEPLPLIAQDIESWKKGFASEDKNDGDETTANKLSPAEEFGPRILETVMMMNSLGHSPDDAVWASLATAQISTDRTTSLHPATGSIMRARLSNASRGEALLVLYQALGGTDPMALSTSAFNDLLALLQQAGAHKAARMLAVERFVSL